MVVVDALRDQELNSYWQSNAKTEMNFLNEAALYYFIPRIREYPKICWDVNTELNFRRLHTKCQKDGFMLAKCMKNTFLLRKHDIFKKELHVKEIIDRYPGLSDYYQIQEEFQRVTRKDVHQFEEEVRDLLWGSVSIDTERLPKCQNRFWKDENKRYKSGGDRTGRSTLMRLRSFIYDKVDGVMDDEFIIYKRVGQTVQEAAAKIKKLEPAILVNGTIWKKDSATVCCEKVKVLTGLSFFQAFLAAYYLSYIFNLKYAPKDENMWKAFDQILETVGEILE